MWLCALEASLWRYFSSNFNLYQMLKHNFLKFADSFRSSCVIHKCVCVCMCWILRLCKIIIFFCSKGNYEEPIHIELRNIGEWMKAANKKYKKTQRNDTRSMDKWILNDNIAIYTHCICVRILWIHWAIYVCSLPGFGYLQGIFLYFILNFFFFSFFELITLCSPFVLHYYLAWNVLTKRCRQK